MVTGLKSEVNSEEQVGAIETDKGILSVYRGQRTSPAVSVKKKDIAVIKLSAMVCVCEGQGGVPDCVR